MTHHFIKIRSALFYERTNKIARLIAAAALLRAEKGKLQKPGEGMKEEKMYNPTRNIDDNQRTCSVV